VSLGPKEVAVKSSRAYTSPLRAAQAQETRRRVLTAARDLFVAQGYPATTIAAVARRAEVSPDTVYSGFGSKAALLKEVLDVAIAGDDEDVALLDRADPQAMRAETDQRTQLAMFAAGMTGQLERLRPMDDVLRSAAAVDAAAAELRADLQLRQRRAAIATVVTWVAANGPLRDGLPDEEATALTWTLTSPEVHQMLRDTWGWSRERYERWLRETLTSSLLP
jgi:AcrR family transcriptional regulator